MGDLTGQDQYEQRRIYSTEPDFDVRRDLTGEHEYPNFLGLLRNLATKPRDSMDAILVPAAREVSDEYAGRIAAVAKQTGTRLFTFVSHQADGGQMAKLLDKMSVPEWWVVEVPDEGHELPFMQFKSPDAIPVHARKVPPSNLGHIRILGSVIGKVMGWDRIIFSDDDVGYEPAALRAVSQMLPGHKIAGMQCGRQYEERGTNGFADKDVVHHAESEIIRFHSSLKFVPRSGDAGHISGNSIAANPQIAGLVFSPEIYNEDLIGFYDMYIEGSAALALDAYYIQTPYDPFDDPERAKWQAFGELIHDGLYLPLLKGKTANLTDLGHWNITNAQRIRKIETLLNGLDATQNPKYFTYMSNMPERDPAHEAKIRASLLAALAMHQTFEGTMGVNFMQAWGDDKTTFRHCVPDLPGRQSIPDALDWLGLSYRSNMAA